MDLRLLEGFGNTGIEDIPVSMTSVKPSPVKVSPFGKVFASLYSKARVIPLLATGYKMEAEKVRVIPTKTSKDLQIFAKANQSFKSPFGHDKGQGNFLDQVLTAGKIPAFKKGSINEPEKPATLENIVFGLVIRDLTAQSNPKVVVQRVKNHFRHLEDFHSYEVTSDPNHVLTMHPITKK